MVAYKDEIAAAYKKTGSVTAETLRELCELVERATGSKVIIMGTRTALSKVTALQNATYVSDAMKDEHYRTGTLGMFEGRELVEIPQVFEKNKVGTYKLSNTMIWFMPVSEEKFLKLVNEGDTQLRTIADKDENMDYTYESEMMTKLGVGVMLNGAYGVWDLEA